MIYMIYDEEKKELIIRPIKEIRIELDSIAGYEATKIIDIDGHEVDYEKEKKKVFVFHITDNFFEIHGILKKNGILDDIKKSIERSKDLKKP